MADLTKAEIAAKIVAYILDNTLRRITPAQMREILGDLNDSTFNDANEIIHNELSGLNDDDYKHLTGIQLEQLATIIGLMSGVSSNVQNQINSKVNSNSPNATPGTYTKATFDAKGLFLNGTDATISDIVDLQEALDSKINLVNLRTDFLNTTNPNYFANIPAVVSYVATQIANLVNSAPTTLDTLNEIATALGNDPNFATTITTLLAGKQPILVSGTNIKTVGGVNILGSGDIPITLATTNGNVLYVSTTGSDADTTRAGHIGNMIKPFLTIEKARDAALSGDLIYVFSGNYTITTTATNGILKDGVSYYLEKGCVLNKATTGILLNGAGFTLPIYVLGYGKFYGTTSCGYTLANTTDDSVIKGLVCHSTSSGAIYNIGSRNTIKFQTVFSSNTRAVTYLGAYSTLTTELIQSTADIAIYRSSSYSKVIANEITTTGTLSIQNDSGYYLSVDCNIVSGEVQAGQDGLYNIKTCSTLTVNVGAGRVVFNGYASNIVNGGQLNGIYYTNNYNSNSNYSNGCPIMQGNNALITSSGGYTKAKIDVEAIVNVSPRMTITGGVVVLEGNWNDTNVNYNSTISGGKLLLSQNMIIELSARKDFISMSGGIVDLSNARINLKSSVDSLVQQYGINTAIRWTGGTLISNGATITTASSENPPILAEASGMNFKVLSGGFNTNYVNGSFTTLSAKKKKYKITITNTANTTIALNDLSGGDESFSALVASYPTKALLAQQLVTLINASGTLDITASQDTPGTDNYLYVESDVAGVNININNGALVNCSWIIIRGNSFAISNTTGGSIIENSNV